MSFQLRIALALLFTLSVFSVSANEIVITPFFGVSVGGEVKDSQGKHYDFDTGEHFSLAIETPMDQGHVGIYLSTQSVEPERISSDINIHYLQFQSSVSYPTKGPWSSYVGLGLGGSYIDAVWVDDNVGFSASAFTGIEYMISDMLSINAQVRWIGTTIDNDSNTHCVSASGQQNCSIHFDADWLNQIQSNIGITFRF